MKYILIIIFCIIATLQSKAQVQYRYGITAFDTLASVTTHYIYPGTNTIAGTTKFKDAGDLEIYVVSDSLSGNPIATANVQFAYDDSAAPFWFSRDTFTINGVQTLHRLSVPSFTALKWRVKLTVAATTQSNKSYAYYTWKRRV